VTFGLLASITNRTFIGLIMTRKIEMTNDFLDNWNSRVTKPVMPSMKEQPTDFKSLSCT
jgi:hypothetical protein